VISSRIVRNVYSVTQVLALERYIRSVKIISLIEASASVDTSIRINNTDPKRLCVYWQHCHAFHI